MLCGRRYGGRVGDALVVEYRDGRPGVVSLPLYHCPQCGKPLRLWWPVGETTEDGGNADLEGG